MIHLGMAILFVVGTSAALSAPHPATSSSFLIGQKNGRFISQHGFVVNGAETGWLHRTSPAGVENIETMYSSPKSQNGVEASLTVRVDRLEGQPTLNAYIKKWVKDYLELALTFWHRKK
jgi:hypothetical protein